MKKALILLTLASGLCSQAFAFEGNRGIAFGAGFGNFFEMYLQGGDANSYLGTPGFNFSSYNFSGGGDTGFFANALAVGVPVFHSATNNFEGSRLRLQTGLAVGIVNRRVISDRLTALHGAGLNFTYYGFDRRGALPEHGAALHYTTNLDFGIATDIGVIYRIGDRLFLYWGGVITTDFLRVRETGIETPEGRRIESNTGLVRGFLMVGARPYLSFGFSF
ncbi:MAG: hypothetical protein FWE09_00565 [Treponema sp.]|nr:hypothetical protein [Treponema sp.]